MSARPTQYECEKCGKTASHQKENTMLEVKRVYEPAAPNDGARFFVERLWPRGMKKGSLMIDGWPKELAPSGALRRWFGHDPAKWDEFCRRYWAELDTRMEAWHSILKAAGRGTVTLLYSARDTEHNSAVALKTYLEKHLKV